MKLKQYKAYVFDMDLTLLDTIKTAIKSYTASFEAIGVEFDVSTVTHHLAIPLTSSYDEVKEKANQPFEVFFETFKQVARDTFATDSFIYEDAYEAIQFLLSKNKKLGIVTNREMTNVESILKGTSIESVFDTIITCDKVSNLKPNPEPIYKALEELGLSNEEVVYIGDAKNDCLAAKNANVDFICVERYNNCDFDCNIKMNTLKEIID